MDMEFPRGRGGPSRKIMEISGAGGSTVKPPGTENPGVGGQTGKNPLWGSMDIFCMGGWRARLHR